MEVRQWSSRAKPPKAQSALDSFDAPELKGLDLLLAIPEFQVPLPGGGRAPQTDVLALAHGPEGLVAIAVEGKGATNQIKSSKACIYYLAIFV